MSCDRRIPIRNLTTLRADMVQELRQAMALITAWQRSEPMSDKEQRDLLTRIDTKVRNVLEYLTGDRE